jgi:murein DD-endopeptidase MepM/ murein hydrolase activator NlpD
VAAPTPIATAIVVAQAAGSPAPRRPTPTPRLVRAAPGRAVARPGWTLLAVPPARAAGPVRTVALGRRHLLLPLLAVTLLLALASFGAALLGMRSYEARVRPELALVRRDLRDAETRLRVLGDSLGVLRAEVGVLAAAREAREAREAALAAARRRAGASRGAGVARAAPARPAEGVVLPVVGRITSRFARSRAHPVLRIRRPHRGLDIAAPSGTTIAAPAAGRVTKVGREIGYGLVVHLDHGNGVTTRYAHCRTTLVSAGQTVAAGTPIATVGRTGLATAPHLHYEVRVRGEAVDPLRVAVAGAP